MKKIAAFLLSAIMLLSMCACKGNEPAYSSSTASDISGDEFQQLIDAAKENRSAVSG